jgi:hypothetical protein
MTVQVEELLPEVDRRKKLANLYYNNYHKYLKEENFSKASEFIYGAITSLLYALALFYGEKLGDHGKFVVFVQELAQIMEDPQLEKEFADIQTIHANFYHNFMSKEVFEIKIKEAENFGRRINEILQKKIDEKT